MANAVKPIPEGLHTITPNLICRNSAKAIEFYKTVFGATEVERHMGPGGKVIHAELKIGDSPIFVNDMIGGKELSGPEPGAPNPMYLHLYVADADEVFGRAVRAGARADMPVQDMFWGDRYGKLTDPFGQQWGIATHKEDVSREELARRQESFFAKAAGGS
jgi:PhnB protein